jgi:hypothetical protein
MAQCLDIPSIERVEAQFWRKSQMADVITLPLAPLVYSC